MSRRARRPSRTHLLFGDRLGPRFTEPGADGPDEDAPIVTIESRAAFRRRSFHRARAHLVLPATRHRAAELGDRVRYVRADTYREGLVRVAGRSRTTVRHPTSHAAARFVDVLPDVAVLPVRGSLVPCEDFAARAAERRGEAMRLEDFHRRARRRHDLLMGGGEPAGGRWNSDRDDREPPPRGRSTLGAP